MPTATRRSSRTAGWPRSRTRSAPCSGSTIHYYARLRLRRASSRMVDAVGGVDVNVAQGFEDPTLRRLRHWTRRGWSITAGRHHLDGIECARLRPSRARPPARATSRGRRASSRSSSRCATQVDEGRQPALGAAGPARRRSATSVRTDMPTDAPPGTSPRSWTRSATTRSPASIIQPPARASGRAPATGRRSGPGPRGDPRRWPPSSSRSPAAPKPWPTPKPSADAEADRQP